MQLMSEKVTSRKMGDPAQEGMLVDTALEKTGRKQVLL